MRGAGVCRYEVVSLTAGLLRKDRPIHLLGIGGVRDIFHGVRQGANLSHTHDNGVASTASLG